MGGRHIVLSLTPSSLRLLRASGSQAEQELAKEMAQEETVLLQNMQEAGDQAAANKGKSAGLLGMGASTIAAAAAAYEADVEATKQQLEEKTGGGSFGVVAAFKRQKGALERQIEALEPRAKEILALRQVSQVGPLWIGRPFLQFSSVSVLCACAHAYRRCDNRSGWKP